MSKLKVIIRRQIEHGKQRRPHVHAPSRQLCIGNLLIGRAKNKEAADTVLQGVAFVSDGRISKDFLDKYYQFR
jgi:hypothetical protein